uniref:Putative tick transposon n=1 Tax=Rhipicephalus pulchellus TaxID=72859 RepID=L7M241_RHIPC
MGTRGTPQGAVLSPLLFNIALLQLPGKLNAIPYIRHALYADDVTIWTTHGNLGQIEEALQMAADEVQHEAEACGLRCAPEKSELLMFRRKGDKAAVHIQVHGTPIPERDSIRILGVTFSNTGANAAVLTKLQCTCEQITRMLSRIANRNRGLQEHDILRLIQAFVICRITYSTPYLHLRKCDIHKLDVLIRNVYKKALNLPQKTSTSLLKALNLPQKTSTSRLLKLGIHNTAAELIEAHLTNQILRLATTKTGRKVLDDLHISIPPTASGRQDIPREWRGCFLTKPLPRNMHPDYHHGRRAARAKALNERYSNTEGAYFVDAAGPVGGISTIAVIHQSEVVDGLSLKCSDPSIVEETAVALAATHSTSEYILTDSKVAYRNYMRGRISPPAHAILWQARTRATKKQLIWVPGHQGVAGNELAHNSARAFLPRALSTDPSDHDIQPPIPATTYADILQLYRLQRQTLPHPAKGLTKAEETCLRRLQTMSYSSPAVMAKIDPEQFSAMCKFCGSRADLFHMVWACQSNKSIAQTTQPTWEGWEEALSSPALEDQRSLVERARLAAQSNGVPE